MRKTVAILSVCGFILSVSYAVLGAQGKASAGVYTAEQATRGEAIYKEQCAACHGDNLEGSGPMPPLAGMDFLTNWTREVARRSVREDADDDAGDRARNVDACADGRRSGVHAQGEQVPALARQRSKARWRRCCRSRSTHPNSFGQPNRRRGLQPPPYERLYRDGHESGSRCHAFDIEHGVGRAARSAWRLGPPPTCACGAPPPMRTRPPPVVTPPGPASSALRTRPVISTIMPSRFSISFRMSFGPERRNRRPGASSPLVGSCPSRAATMKVRPFAHPGTVMRVESFGDFAFLTCAARSGPDARRTTAGSSVFHDPSVRRGRSVIASA